MVVIPEPEPEIVNNLVDMSIPSAAASAADDSPQDQQPPPINFEDILRDRDELIMHLQSEVERLAKNLKAAAIHKRDEHAQFEEHIASLNSQLSDAHEELTNMRFIKEELELKAQNVEKLQVEEERLKSSEEKFNKLKTMYAQIRDEHVKLLRQVIHELTLHISLYFHCLVAFTLAERRSHQTTGQFYKGSQRSDQRSRRYQNSIGGDAVQA